MIAMLVGLSAAGVASGYFTTVDQAWGQVSVVVLGIPQLVTPQDELYRTRRAIYAVEVIHAYKGSTDGARVEFLDQSWGSTGNMIHAPGSPCVLFLMTAEDRRREAWSPAEPSDVLTGLMAYPVKKTELPEMNAALAMVETYNALPDAKRDAAVVEHLSWKNRFLPNFFAWQALNRRIQAAAPHFRDQLWRAGNEEEVKTAITYLLNTAGPDTKPTLLAFLSDPACAKKAAVIEEMAAYKDPEYLPPIRAQINAADELVAGAARRALYQLGEPAGKALLFALIAKSHDPKIRLRAIEPMEKARASEFSDVEKASVRKLTRDKDEQVARVARLIAHDW